MSDTTLQNVEGVVLVALIVGFVLWYLVSRLTRSRPDFRIGVPLAVGIGLRLAAIAGIGALGLDHVLRGGDESTFLTWAHNLARQPFGSGDLPHGPYQLHVVVFAEQLRLGFLTTGALRITQVGLAMVGFVLLLAAVYDLAGGRAARLAAWVLALEPASIFFDSALHKEPLMELASGLVVFGGTMIWRRLDVRGILLCALGGLIAVETRSYAGWFLVTAAVLLVLHAALRNTLYRPTRSLPLVYGVAIIAFLATPVLVELSSNKSLQTLQGSQNANTVGVQSSTGPNANNLALEQVNFSSRGTVITGLPRRIRDLLIRPYPWQLADTSQRFGAVGTLFAYAILLLLIRYAWLSRGHIFPRAAPLLYPLLLLLIAYALAVGNAGTGFRYRTHLITLTIAAMVVLREHVIRARAESPAEKKAFGEAGTPRRVKTPVASPGRVVAPVRNIGQ